MRLLQQLSRLVQTEQNPQLQPFGDPGTQIAAAMACLQDHRLELRLTIAHAIASQRRCQRHQTQAEAWANHWQYQARMALEQSDESLARQALDRWQTHRKSAQRLQEQFQQQQNLTSQLQQIMTDLENKLQAAQSRKDLLMAQSQGLEAKLALEQTLATLAPETAQSQAVVADTQQLKLKASQISAQAERFEREWAMESQFRDLNPDLGQIPPA
jgi:phage shock protein A